MPFTKLSAVPDSSDHRELAFKPRRLTPQQAIHITLERAVVCNGLAPLLSRILHRRFLSTLYFSCWHVSTLGFFCTPHSHRSRAKLRLLSQQPGLPTAAAKWQSSLWRTTETFAFKGKTGQLRQRSFAKIITRQMFGSASRKRCPLSELSFSENSSLSEARLGCSLTKDIISIGA